MAQILTDDKHYKKIAAKVRAVKGSTEMYLPSELPAAVLSLGDIESPILNAPHAVAYDINGNPTVIGGIIANGLYAYTDITSIDLSDLAVVPKGLCAACTELSSVVFSDRLTHIQDYAFYRCYRLQTLNFPNTLTHIGASAFEDFGYDTQGVDLAFPASLKYIGDYAFCHAEIKSISFNEGLEEISEYAFWNIDTDIKTITLPGSLKVIGDYAFGAIYSLTTVNFKGTPDSIGETALDHYTIKTINVPWAEGTIPGAPWGATNATINYNVTP